MDQSVQYIQHEWKGDALLNSHEILKPDFDKHIALQAKDVMADHITVQRIIRTNTAKHSAIVISVYKSDY